MVPSRSTNISTRAKLDAFLQDGLKGLRLLKPKRA
jgi:hypothetical protein